MYQYGLAEFGQGIPNLPGVQTNNWEEFMKAVTAGYGTDSNTLTGGGALRIESLEHTLMAITQTMKDFALFNRLKKTPATATVDEWTELNSVGGRPGSSFNSELGDIKEQSGSYARRTAQVKYLMTRRSVSMVQATMNTIVDTQAQEEVNGTLELLTSAEWAFWNGDSDVVPEEFDGFPKIINSLNSPEHIIDHKGQPFDGAAGFQAVMNAAQIIRRRQNFGIPTDIFLSTGAQTDLDLNLDPAFRVPLTDVPQGGIQKGAPVRGIRTSWGDIANCPDIFIEDGVLPLEAENASAATDTDPTKPDSVTLAATGSGSTFQAGTYMIGVAAISAKGQSKVVFAGSAVTLTAGQKIQITINHAGSITDVSGYAIFRGRKDIGSPTVSDIRLVKRVPFVAGASQVETDDNTDMPGTSKAFVLNLNPAFEAVGWRQLLPMTKFPLYPTVKAEIPWAQLLFGYLRVTKARQCVMIKNILPSTAKNVWDPGT